MLDCSKALGQLLKTHDHPHPFASHGGTARRSWSEDLRNIGLERGQSSPEMYWGAKLCKALKTNKITSKSILYLASSQYSDASTGVMLSPYLVQVNSLAAAFCTSCKQDKVDKIPNR